MVIEDRFFDQEWVQELTNEEFRMLLYLMHFATKKCGIVELNMRMLNYAANTGRQFTMDEVLSRFSGMLSLVPGKSSTAIFPNWVATNWAKTGKEIDIQRNPLFKSVVQELASYGMTIDSLNSMAKMKVMVKESAAPVPNPAQAESDLPQREPERHAKAESSEVAEAFERFWREYPGPRKVDKKKCLARFASAVSKYKTIEEGVSEIENGLMLWKRCSTWNKDNGQYIRAPLVWLNNENWKDVPDGVQQTDGPDMEAIRGKADEITERLRKEGLM
jgi:hypothetical protein